MKKILAWIKPVKYAGGPGEPGEPDEPGEPGEPDEPDYPEEVEPPIYIPGLPDEPVQPLPPIPPVVPPGGGKPTGFPTLPMDPAWTAPTAPPHPPGTWVTINAGKGHPPAWAFVGQDDGLTPSPTGGPPTPASASGHWVPIGPAKQPKGQDASPVWAWVPHIGPDYGIKPAAQPRSK